MIPSVLMVCGLIFLALIVWYAGSTVILLVFNHGEIADAVILICIWTLVMFFAFGFFVGQLL